MMKVIVGLLCLVCLLEPIESFLLLDPCSYHHCSDRGICVPILLSYQCICLHHYHGKDCELEPTTTTTAPTTAAHLPVFTTAPTINTGIKAATTTPLLPPAVTATSSMIPSSSESLSTTVTSTLTVKQSVSISCSGKGITDSIISQTVHSNNDTCTCSSGSCASPEAFVLNLCNGLTPSSTWKPDDNVVSSCNSLPLYTPIALFKNGVHNTHDISGILVKCVPNGFVIATQTCDRSPTVKNVEINGPSGSLDARDFYTINT